MYWFVLGIAASMYLYVWIYLSMNMLAAHSAMNGMILLALCVPRLHDMGKSGWFFLFLGLPLLFAAVIGHFSPPESQYTIALLMLAAIAGSVILLGIVPGDPKPNRWGGPPDLGLAIRRGVNAELLRLTQKKDG